MPIYALHRHARAGTTRSCSIPTRFAPEQEAAISRYQYMPFGAGPRICIGMAFAMIEATAMLATMLQSARFGLVPGRDRRCPWRGSRWFPRAACRCNVWMD